MTFARVTKAPNLTSKPHDVLSEGRAPFLNCVVQLRIRLEASLKTFVFV